MSREWKLWASGLLLGVALVLIIDGLMEIFGAPAGTGALPAPAVEVKPTELYRIDPPPDEYIGGAKLLVYFADPATVAIRCMRARQLGCAHPDENAVTLTDPCFFPDDEYASLVCHEKAHILGYRHPTPWYGTELDIENEKMAQDILLRVRAEPEQKP